MRKERERRRGRGGEGLNMYEFYLNVEVGNEGVHESERRNFDSEEKIKLG